MGSRRRFLQGTSAALSGLLPGLSGGPLRGAGGAAQDNAAQRDYWNDLPNRMIEEVNAARSKRKGELAQVKTTAAAQERTIWIREKVWELVGGKLERTPLNAKTTGAIDRANYRIEKVIFESQPEFYVPAHLYIPKAGKGPYPGILAPLGHTAEGKTYRSYQTLFQNLARQGFAVLTWDPPGQGERLQYLDAATNRSPYGPTGEHDRFGWPALLIGSSTTQFEAWDGIRALDYLLSRPEIDPKRIGCCGHSGGGTQTMFLCALEPRIQVAVVVEGHTENLAGADYQPPGAYADAEQNLIGGLRLALDRGDLLAAFAPKPLLICVTPIDGGTTYSPHYIAGTEEIVSELKNVYSVYGSEEKIGLFRSTLPHDYDYFHRRATYQWVHKYLLSGKESREETAFEDAPESSLWCTSTGQVLTSLGGRPAYQVNADRLRMGTTRWDGKRQEKEQVRKELRELLALPGQKSPLRARTLSTNTQDSLLIEEFEYESEPGIRVPGWFIKPTSGASPYPVLLLLEDQGKDALFDRWKLVESSARSGVAICSVDLRTSGVTRPRLPAQGPAFYGFGVELAYSLVNLSLGAPIVGQQTWDLLRCLDYLESRTDVAAKPIAIYGRGTSGLPCVAAAVLDQRCQSLLLDRTIVDLACIVTARDYELPLSAVAFGMLKKFDLPELCSYLTPRPLWLVNSVGAQGTGLAVSEIQARYETAERAYKGANQADKFVLRVEPGAADQTVSDWLRQVVI